PFPNPQAPQRSGVPKSPPQAAPKSTALRPSPSSQSSQSVPAETVDSPPPTIPTTLP
ncbi:19814_t:CDS:1, partial [Racocetra persica]